MKFVAYPKALATPYQNLGAGRVLETALNARLKTAEVFVQITGNPQRQTASDRTSRLKAGDVVVLLRGPDGALTAVAESDFTPDMFVELGADLKPILPQPDTK